MLPPHELKNKTFTRAMRGYNPVEVDEYVDFLIEKYTELYRENDELERKLKSTAAKLDEIRGEEDSIRSALIEAKRTSAQIKADAEQQAEMIIRSAKTSCNNILANFNSKIEEGHATLVALKSDAAILKQELFARYSEHIEAIRGLTDGIDMTDVPDTDELRREAIASLKAGIADAYAQTVAKAQSKDPEPAVESAPAVEETAEEPLAEVEDTTVIPIVENPTQVYEPANVDDAPAETADGADESFADDDDLTFAPSESASTAFNAVDGKPELPDDASTQVFASVTDEDAVDQIALLSKDKPLAVERTRISNSSRQGLKNSVAELNKKYKAEDDVINTPDSDVEEDSNYLDFVMSVTGKDQKSDAKKEADLDLLFTDPKSGKKKK